MPVLSRNRQYQPRACFDPSGGVSWTTVFTNALDGGTETGWAGSTLVVTIPTAALSAASGQTCRITIKFSALGNGTTVQAFMAQQGAGDVYDFNTTPATINFSGSGTITGDGSTLTYVSDSFSLPEAYDHTKNYNVAFNFGAGTVTALSKALTGAHIRYLGSPGDAATVNKSGYLSDSDGTHEFVSQIEISA
jgi:hypothetical protein